MYYEINFFHSKQYLLVENAILYKTPPMQDIIWYILDIETESLLTLLNKFSSNGKAYQSQYLSISTLWEHICNFCVNDISYFITKINDSTCSEQHIFITSDRTIPSLIASNDLSLRGNFFSVEEFLTFLGCSVYQSDL